MIADVSVHGMRTHGSGDTKVKVVVVGAIDAETIVVKDVMVRTVDIADKFGRRVEAAETSVDEEAHWLGGGQRCRRSRRLHGFRGSR